MIDVVFNTFNDVLPRVGGDYYIFKWKRPGEDKFLYQVDAKSRINSRIPAYLGRICLGCAYDSDAMLALLRDLK